MWRDAGCYWSLCGVRNGVFIRMWESQSEILHDDKKSTEVRLFSRQLSLAIIYVYSECVPRCLCTLRVCEFECVWVRAQQGHSHVCLERVLSVSWNAALPPMLRWLPSSKMAARITPRQWDTHTCRGARVWAREALFHLLFLFLHSCSCLSVSNPLSLCVDKRCFVGSETGLLLFLLSNLWLSVAARQVLLAGICVLCYHLQPADKHLLQLVSYLAAALHLSSPGLRDQSYLSTQLCRQEERGHVMWVKTHSRL